MRTSRAIVAVSLLAVSLVGGIAGAALPVRAAPIQPVDVFDLGFASKDLVFDAHSGTMFASVGNGAPAYANTVVPVDAATGLIGTPIAVGLEPNRLALSGDGSYLYVGLDANGLVARVALASRSVDLEWSLGSAGNRPLTAGTSPCSRGTPARSR